ncbi:hypothetical protein [Flavobacterium pectinovorum]|uniref:Uncharacterized protein n=1 Tax=Flavobacterium pectinovorum TaxID=29533 RepID=A0A502F118_9FLAO|nr:hypothetical protein [Flavobacterium pectinovorum]TPG42131.1 hypothetical protein EAH81_07370 [Flavobacterium pectinovorum]
MNKINLKISLFLSFLILFLSVSCYGKSDYDASKISNKTNQIIKKIETVNVLMGSAVGAAGRTPKQFENFEELKKNASLEELIMLTNHPNAVVRCYSFWALLRLKNIDLFSIVKNHLGDDSMVQTQFGCIGSSEKVGDFYIQLVTTDYEDDDVSTKLLNERQLKILDSLLIYSENNLNMRFDAISKAEPTEDLYPKVRELVIKENNQSALVTLAKYRKESDIELILKNKDIDEDAESGYFSTYKAIQNFPDVRFLPLLEKNLNNTLDEDYFSQEWRELYLAIASYKSQKSLELLSIPFTKVKNKDIKKYHIEFVNNAILVNKCKIYDDLLWKIWQEEHLITLESFKYFLQLNKAKTLELSKREFIPNYQIKDIESIPKTRENMFTESLEETILNFILINDKLLAYNLISDKIANETVSNFEIYCKKASELKDRFFIEPLFKRMKTEDNAYVYLEIVETLISFKDDSINKKDFRNKKTK